MSWLVPFSPVDGRPVLVCLPQAGAGCGVFRSWQDLLGDTAAVVGVQLPGRENRFVDPPPASFAAAVADIVSALEGIRPTVLFGHSLGGLLGYEVVRALPVPPEVLVLAAALPPHRSGRVAGSIALDTDEGFAKWLAEKELDEDMRELAMETLRQDAALSATYADPGGAKVLCELHSWGGEDDDRVPADRVAEWCDYTAGAFHTRQFPGGHDFCLETPTVPAAVRDLLRRA